jgi:catechol 2,3-dioxygenase-like lactoylglutathione lyase family enzyme
MGKKLRTGDPWIPGYKYGALLPPLSINLIVLNVGRSVQFYQDVLAAKVHYHDVDFAAMRVGGAEVMLHADHTHEDHPWYPTLASGATRGLGAQIRLLGIDPDETERRARAVGAVVAVGTTTKGHGWREVIVRDPDGYEWGVGVLVDPPKK